MSREFLGMFLGTWQKEGGWLCLNSSHIPFSKLLFIFHYFSLIDEPLESVELQDWTLVSSESLAGISQGFSQFFPASWTVVPEGFPGHPPERVLIPQFGEEPTAIPNPALPPPSPLCSCCAPGNGAGSEVPLRSKAELCTQWHLLPEKILFGGDVLGKEWGKLVQSSLWFVFGVVFFSFSAPRTPGEPSPPWGMLHTGTALEQSICHGVGPAEWLKNGLCLSVFVFQLDYCGFWHDSQTHGWWRRKSSNQLSLNHLV